MSGRLLVIATPIGNLGDMSPRAADALRAVPLVLAEDTRRSRPLLEHLGSAAKLVSCHQHNELERIPLVLERLRAGDDVGLVSDAGAPGLSDPGGRVVDAVVAEGLPVEVLPGPSAVIAALMGAGLVSHRFAFLGFLPRRRGAQREQLRQVSPQLALVLFEAPGRVADTLSLLAEELGPRRVVVARELTKRFETFHRGVLGGPLEPPLVDKGEVVVVVEANEGVSAEAPPVDAEATVAQLQHDASLTPRQRAKLLAKALGISPRDAYARMLATPQQAFTGASQHAEELLAPALVPAPEVRSLGLRDVQDALVKAVDAFCAADAAAGRERGLDAHTPPPHEAAAEDTSSGIRGADDLLRWLRGTPKLPAPVEAAGLARALLGALAALDALDDALEHVDEAKLAGRAP